MVVSKPSGSKKGAKESNGGHKSATPELPAASDSMPASSLKVVVKTI